MNYFKAVNSTIAKGKPLTVLLFGWTDGSIRSVSKYAKLYNEMGYDCYVFVGTGPDIFFPGKLLKSFSTLNTLDVSNPLTQPNSDRSYLVHCFSNGGVFLLSCMQKAVRHFPSYSIAGMILDSCPSGSKQSPKSFVGAFTSTIKNPYIKAIASVFVYVMGFVDVHLFGFARQFARSLQHKDFLVPRLYLYSDADYIVPAHGIQESMASFQQQLQQQQQHQQQPTVSVDKFLFSHNFKDSPHVLHLKAYPREYEEQIRSFIQHLDNNSNNNNDSLREKTP